MTAHNHGRVSPFGHPRINAQLTTPRGISQSPTSFIGPLYQGIHRTPFTHFTHNCAAQNDTRKIASKEDTRVHYTVLKQHQAPHTPPAAQHHDQHTRHPHQEHTTTSLSQTPNTMTNQTRPPPTATHKPHTTHTGQSSTRKKHSHAPDNRTRGNKPKNSLERR